MKKKVVALTLGGVAMASVLGLGAGAAFGSSPLLLAPLGITANKDVATAPMPQPTYSLNPEGLTFGSAADSNSPANEPDLIQAVATNGKTGFVRKADLDLANGTTAAESFKSPAEALAWQETAGKLDRSIPVYAVDGTTVIGEFTIEGSEGQAKSLGK